MDIWQLLIADVDSLSADSLSADSIRALIDFIEVGAAQKVTVAELKGLAQGQPLKTAGGAIFGCSETGVHIANILRAARILGQEEVLAYLRQHLVALTAIK